MGMKANEFIKKFGWGTSKFCLDNCLSPNDKWFMHEGESIYDEDFDELKRLVESWRFINEHGGIERGKNWYKSSPFKNNKYMRELKQAILDVESCQ